MWCFKFYISNFMLKVCCFRLLIFFNWLMFIFLFFKMKYFALLHRGFDHRGLKQKRRGGSLNYHAHLQWKTVTNIVTRRYRAMDRSFIIWKSIPFININITLWLDDIGLSSEWIDSSEECRFPVFIRPPCHRFLRLAYTFLMRHSRSNFPPLVHKCAAIQKLGSSMRESQTNR